jgi:hypothetical protein
VSTNLFASHSPVSNSSAGFPTERQVGAIAKFSFLTQHCLLYMTVICAMSTGMALARLLAHIREDPLGLCAEHRSRRRKH